MSRNSRTGRSLWLLAALLVASSLGAAEGDYRLLPHPDGPCRSGSGCVPLILIHGIHGSDANGPCGLDSSTVTDCNWGPLFAYLSQRNPSLWRRLRVYVFRYLADRDDSFIEMGRRLRSLTDRERVNWNQPVIVVAQSMGGLVARAFLASWPHPMLPRGLHLTGTVITLATPHHGTPLANRLLRNRLAEDNTGSPASQLDLFDFLYWSWSSSPQLASNAEEPSRSDLLWDEYDGLFDGPRQDPNLASIEVNRSLAQLRATPGDGMKLIVYGGYMPFDGMEDGPIGYAAPPDQAPRQADGVGQLLGTAGRLLRQRLGKPWNDGFVPLDSALFSGNPYVVRRRVFIGYDHQDMMGNRSRVEHGVDLQAALLERLALDIAAAAEVRSSRFPALRPESW